MSRPVVLMPSPMPGSVEEACSERFDLVRLWTHNNPDALLASRGPDVRGLATSGGNPVPSALLERLPGLEIIANFGVGYDNVDTAAAHRRGVVVTNTPHVLDEEVADTAMGLLLMTARQLSHAERYLRAGRWEEKPFPLSPSNLSGRTMGILGLGRIGLAIARRAEAFGLDVVYHNRRPRDDVPFHYCGSLLAMAQAVDILMLTLPGGTATRRLVDREVLDALGPDGILINVARGSVVDESALIEALRDRRVLSAGLDVFEDEPLVPQALLDMEHVVLLPHVGSASEPTRRAMGQLVVDNLTAWFERKQALTPVPQTR